MDWGVGFWVWRERKRKRAGRKGREGEREIDYGFGVIEREWIGMRERESNGVKVYLFC